MNESGSMRAQQIAEAASAFERERTGCLSKSVAVVLAGETVVITLHGALSAAEQALSKSRAGAVLVQEFHRELFANACGPLRQDVARITGVEVREASAEAQGAAGTMVLIFRLDSAVTAETWGGAAPAA